MSRSTNWAAVAALVLLASTDPGRAARGQAIGPGFELERSGRYADAATIYFTMVRTDPTNLPALLRLERTLFVLSRVSELLPLVQNARARQPDSPALRSLELRVYAALNEPDSLEAIARRWAASAPQSEAPYREWGLALADRRMWDEARRAFLTGRRTLGGDVLAIELAELEQRVGNWEASAMEPTLATTDTEAPTALRRFADLAGALTTPDGHRVRGLALARWADMMPGSSGARARAEAVRELRDGGDKAAARRVLEAHADSNGIAQAALIHLLIADNQLDIAEERLSAPATAITADDRATLRLALARARVGRGELDRAAAALGNDSSVAAIAQRGWIDLYRGNLRNAMEAFRLAGPYALDRAAATDRTAMMALLQRIQQESSPDLGAALLTLARGDSVAAIAALRRAAARLPEQGGRLEVLLLAGQVAAQKGGDQELTAIALFDEIVRAGGEGAAPPAAELEWARVLVRSGRSVEAIPHLEHLILTYPSSAFVPEARRVLERAKGAIPKS